MAQCSTFHRMSVGSLDDDQFYSAPSSRHASLIAAQFNPHETDHSHLPLEPSVSIRQPSRCISVSPTEIHSSVSTCTLKPRWPRSLTMGYRRHPRYRHFCPKPLSRRLDRTLHKTSDSITLQPLTNESDIGTNGYTTPLISSPTSPIATDHWSSIFPGNHSPHSERSHSSIDLPLGNPISIDKQATDAIVCNIRAYLSNKRHNDCSLRTGMLQVANENHPPSELQTRQSSHEHACEATSDNYLVTTSDIAGILDIVIARVRCIHHDGAAARCLSMLLPKEALLKPIPNITAIVPGSPGIADPATTICSVKPSFSVASCSTYNDHHHSSARATFISRQSITEVT
ncbi:hypothetical protein F4776DRAFT_317300 [Hypoxylon sp. NC0597]|nr:hypothetical protein F4776DRAFT_317300 [Hypoxylon sp. NC0597]